MLDNKCFFHYFITSDKSISLPNLSFHSSGSKIPHPLSGKKVSSPKYTLFPTQYRSTLTKGKSLESVLAIFSISSCLDGMGTGLLLNWDTYVHNDKP